MAPVLEFESKSVEDAVQEASRQLNIPPDKLEHDIISYGSTGIFGLVGSKNAKIRVVVPGDGVSNEIVKRTEENTTQKEVEPTVMEGVAEKAPATVVSEENIALGKDILQKMVDSITIDATISATPNGGKLIYEVSGGNTAVLIGRKGQTLEAMQHILEKIINKRLEDRIRVEVDVEGYLQNQRERLEKLALRVSEKVKKNGIPVTVGQFNAHDRRIIHLALKEDRDVGTHSIGEGYYRKLKIYPKRNRRTPPFPNNK